MLPEKSNELMLVAKEKPRALNRTPAPDYRGGSDVVWLSVPEERTRSPGPRSPAVGRPWPPAGHRCSGLRSRAAAPGPPAAHWRGAAAPSRGRFPRGTALPGLGTGPRGPRGTSTECCPRPTAGRDSFSPAGGMWPSPVGAPGLSRMQTCLSFFPCPGTPGLGGRPPQGPWDARSPGKTGRQRRGKSQQRRNVQ